jgi:MoaA/NifB/PqqE/SkfB family radical SAM enzyme
MCFYAGDMAAQRAPDLTFEQIEKISKTAGTIKRLWISGGEPTLREDLPEIIAMFYRNNHITDINFPSNGIKKDVLIDFLKRIRRDCPDCNISMSLSFDGFPATHDTQRGVSCFYKACDTLKALVDNFDDDGHMIPSCATVITKYNAAEVADFMRWVYGRFHLKTHTIEAARGVTREEGVKVMHHDSLVALQDEVMPWYKLYAKRVGEGANPIKRMQIEFGYTGLMRTMYDIRAENIDGPACWDMDCTAGETTMVLDSDGRFRACELREPVGTLADYDFDLQKIQASDAWKNEIAAIGHGYKANCWCTHGCWIMASLTFNPKKMIQLLKKGNKEVDALYKAAKKAGKLEVKDADLEALEDKYGVDRAKLREIGIIK